MCNAFILQVSHLRCVIYREKARDKSNLRITRSDHNFFIHKSLFCLPRKDHEKLCAHCSIVQLFMMQFNLYKYPRKLLAKRITKPLNIVGHVTWKNFLAVMPLLRRLMGDQGIFCKKAGNKIVLWDYSLSQLELMPKANGKLWSILGTLPNVALYHKYYTLLK